MSTPDGLANLVYIGTFTTPSGHMGGRAEGIYVYRTDPSSGKLVHVQTCPAVINPSFIVLDPLIRNLYAVNEIYEDVDGQPGGMVSAFSIDQDTGHLTYLNRQPSHGLAPCHLTMDRTGDYVLVANYQSGSVAILPVQSDGGLSPASDFVQHIGSSIHPRQKGPHAHSVTIDPANRYALVCDLGLDRIMVYRLDLADGRLIPNDPPWTQVSPGLGPRHMAFHPSARYVYVVNELASSITAFAYDPDRGALEEIHALTTLPQGFSGRNSCADVHLAPSGKFAYGSNRGHNSIAIFAIDESTGRLTAVGHESTQGEHPRNFAIDPMGAFLFVANQNSDSVVSFRIDQQTGQLAPTGYVANVLSPVCLQFAEVRV